MVATATRAAQSSIQVVTTGAAGQTSRASDAVLQAVVTSTAAHMVAASSTVQMVTYAVSRYVLSASSVLQMVMGGANVGSERYAAARSVIQPVYTTGIQDIPRRLAWTYTLDGHYFYCLDLGADGTHVYDLSTQQWTVFDTVGYGGHFNFKNGILWKTGKRVVGGDILTGAVYEMDADSYLDDGWRPTYYEARGALFIQGVAKRKNYALRLVGSTGRLADSVAPVLNMQFSDDAGGTWSNEYSITLTTDTKQRLEWRSLGAFAAPGRIFRLYDTGGLKYIGWAEADIG